MALLTIDAQTLRWVSSFRSPEIGRPILNSLCVDPDGVLSATDGYRAMAVPGKASWLTEPSRVMLRGPLQMGRGAREVMLSFPDALAEREELAEALIHVDGKPVTSQVLVDDGALYPDVRGRIAAARSGWERHSLQHRGEAPDRIRLDTRLGEAFVFTEGRGEAAVTHYPQLRFCGTEQPVLVTYAQHAAVGLWMPCTWHIPMTESEDAWLTSYTPPANPVTLTY